MVKRIFARNMTVHTNGKIAWITNTHEEENREGKVMLWSANAILAKTLG